jgi:3-deoxy-D-manno-octulosonic-acid transferase
MKRSATEARLTSRERFALVAYSMLWYALSPLILAYLLYRSIRQPDYRKHWGERFAYSLPSFEQIPADDFKGVIWVHTVSLGETRAATSLLQAIRRAYPDHRLLLSHGTPTGREAGAVILATLGYQKGQTLQLYLPYDSPWAIDRFFDRYRPKIGLIIETEVWPNLMNRAKSYNITMILLSARLSEKSLKKAMRYKHLIESALLAFKQILCQTEQDLKRIKIVAPDVYGVVCGNLKFDLELSQDLICQGKKWRAARPNAYQGHDARPATFRSSPAWVLAASTREGEEELLIDQWLSLSTETRAYVVLAIVPRHPQRFEQVAQLLERRCKGQWIRRTDPAFPQFQLPTMIVLGDSLGEMAAWYALSDVVVMGGSLINTGSQNLIEACAAGRPVILGPSIYNFEEAADQAISAGAAIQTQTSEVLTLALELLENPKRLDVMGQAAKTFVAAHQGATARVLTAIEPYLTS